MHAVFCIIMLLCACKTTMLLTKRIIKNRDFINRLSLALFHLLCRGVLRDQSKIYDGAFLRAVNFFRKKLHLRCLIDF